MYFVLDTNILVHLICENEQIIQLVEDLEKEGAEGIE